MSSPVPNRIHLYRIVHVDSLPTILARDALHAPNATPNDGLPYRTIHSTDVQTSRHVHAIPCGPGGTCHDYVPFYFGPLSVMLLNLKTGRVASYNEGQSPVIYLVTTMQEVQNVGSQFVFSDGHGLAKFTNWYDHVCKLDQVDWNIVGERYWRDQLDDNDRQRRKQAEFLIWRSLPWSIIKVVGVLNQTVKAQVETVLNEYSNRFQPKVAVKPDWYY
jgi:hypothetical protein